MTCHFATRDPGPHARAPDSRRGVRAARHEQGAPQTWRCCGWLGNHQFYPCLSHEFALVVEVSTPLKNMKVKWDDELANIWTNTKMFQTTNQSL